MTIPQGLSYYTDIISKNEEKELYDLINKQKWDTRLSRRVQHYGYLYNYKNVINDVNIDLTIPEWLINVYDKLLEKNIATFTDKSKLQIIINEYKCGLGISKHIDDINKFGDWVISLTIGSGCNIEFEKKDDKHIIYVERRSVYKMENDSRKIWTHCIRPVKYDLLYKNNEKIKRDTRISITFRNVI